MHLQDEGGRAFHDATTDPAQIARLSRIRAPRWSGSRPATCPGLTRWTSIRSTLRHELAPIAEAKLPSTRTYQTCSGGFHLLFEHSAGIHNTESHIAKGVDTRGTGGYIVFWFAAGFPCTDYSAIAQWPDWLLEALFYKPKPEPIPIRRQAFRSNSTSAQNLIAAAIRKVESATEGHRHATLRTAACAIGGVLAPAGMSHNAARRLLLDAILVAGGARVDQRNALSTIDFGLKWGAALPLALTGAA